MGQRGSSYGWVVVGAAALITCVGMGALFSLGIFLKPIEESTGWSRSAISTVALLNWLAMGLGSFFWGMLSDRVGTRVVAGAGGLLLGLGQFVSTFLITQLYVRHSARSTDPIRDEMRERLEHHDFAPGSRKGATRA